MNMKKTKDKNNLFIYGYIFPIAYMYLVTVCGYFRIMLPLSFLSRSRTNFLVLLTLIGVFCIIYKIGLRNRIYISPTISVAILFSIYMFIRGVYSLEDMGANKILTLVSVTMLWSITFFIVGIMQLKDKEQETISLIISLVTIAISSVYILNKDNDFTVEGYNSIYYIVTMLPFAYLVNNKFIKYLTILLAIMAIFSSQKSLCIIAIILMLLYCLIGNRKKLKKKVLLINLIAVIIILLILLIWSREISAFIQNNAIDLVNDLQTGNGRYTIYTMIIEETRNLGFLDMLFGKGYMGVANELNIGAHNDFLEVVYDYGLIGLGLYIILWLCLIKQRFNITEQGHLIKSYDLMLIVYFIVSLGSNFINTQIQMIPIVILFGMASKNNRNKFKRDSIKATLIKGRKQSE